MSSESSVNDESRVGKLLLFLHRALLLLSYISGLLPHEEFRTVQALTWFGDFHSILSSHIFFWKALITITSLIMSSPKHEPRYDTIEEGDIADLGHESDTTACSDSFLQKAVPLNKRAKRSLNAAANSNALAWLRWGAVIVLQSAVLIVLVLVYSNQNRDVFSSDVETGSDINGIFKTGTTGIIFVTRNCWH